MIVVIDTNVFISACLGTGAAGVIIAHCLRGALKPLMGAALFAEYEDVLARDSLFVKSRLNRLEREELLEIFLSTCRWTQVFYGWRPNLRDEGDNHLIELAVAGSARCVVTSNIKDFREAELNFPGLRIITPANLVQEIGI